MIIDTHKDHQRNHWTITMHQTKEVEATAIADAYAVWEYSIHRRAWGCGSIDNGEQEIVMFAGEIETQPGEAPRRQDIWREAINYLAQVALSHVANVQVP